MCKTMDHVKGSFAEEDFVEAKGMGVSAKTCMERNQEMTAALEYIISKSANTGLEDSLLGLLDREQKYDPIELSGIFFNNSPGKRRADQETPRF